MPSDAPVPRIRDRSRSGVRPDDEERDRRDGFRVLVRVEEEQDRDEDEPSSRANERPEGANGESEEDEEEVLRFQIVAPRYAAMESLTLEECSVHPLKEGYTGMSSSPKS